MVPALCKIYEMVLLNRLGNKNMNEREWLLDDESVDELYEYKNLGVVKDYTGSFSSNVQDNIDKTRKRQEMIFSANFDCCKVNPLMYVKCWWQACLPILLYGSELFTITPNLLEKLERCQLWFIRNIFYVPKFTPKQFLLKLLRQNSVESQEDAIFGSNNFECQNGSSCPKPI